MARPAAPRCDERQAVAAPVACARCGAVADVVKFSPQHTSVQWTAGAVPRCERFRDRAAEGALVDGCPAMRDSIDAAVAAGRLAVSPPWYREPSDERARHDERAGDSARLPSAGGGEGDP